MWYICLRVTGSVVQHDKSRGHDGTARGLLVAGFEAKPSHADQIHSLQEHNDGVHPSTFRAESDGLVGRVAADGHVDHAGSWNDCQTVHHREGLKLSYKQVAPCSG